MFLRNCVVAAVCVLMGLTAVAGDKIQGKYKPIEGSNVVESENVVKLDLETSPGRIKGEVFCGGNLYTIEGTLEESGKTGDFMHRTLLSFTLFDHLFRLSIWKIIGYVGTAIFAGRWFVQLHASRKARKPVMNRLFWVMSLAGSLMILAYFVFGKNDSVGVLSNLFPSSVALYNLYLDIRHHSELKAKGNGGEQGAAV